MSVHGYINEKKKTNKGNICLLKQMALNILRVRKIRFLLVDISRVLTGEKNKMTMSS